VSADAVSVYAIKVRADLKSLIEELHRDQPD